MYFNLTIIADIIEFFDNKINFNKVEVICINCKRRYKISTKDVELNPNGYSCSHQCSQNLINKLNE
jgi:hypothetical protein